MENMKARKEINVEQFIVEWEKHQCLWNVTSEGYKDRNFREKALANLKESFQISSKYLIFAKRYKLSRHRVCPLVFRFFTLCFCFGLSFSFPPSFFNILFDLLLVADLKAKINSLRTYFSSELAKESTTSGKRGSGKDEVFKSKWPYFQSLEFLRDSVTPRKTTSSLASYVLQKQSFSDVFQNRCS